MTEIEKDKLRDKYQTLTAEHFKVFDKYVSWTIDKDDLDNCRRFMSLKRQLHLLNYEIDNVLKIAAKEGVNVYEVRRYDTNDDK